MGDGGEGGYTDRRADVTKLTVDCFSFVKGPIKYILKESELKREG